MERSQEQLLGDLMIAYQNGDAGAFERLYALLAEDVRRYFAAAHRDRAVARDLVQEMFLEMHRSRRTYSPPLPVRPWIFGIARNVSARHRRAAHLVPQGLPLFDCEDALAIAAPAGDMPSAESLDVENALATLPASTREPWLLHHLFGFSFESIATRLGITVVAAKLRSSRATKALRAALRTGRESDHE